MRAIILLSLALALPLRGGTRVVLLHFSDYHSHAIPFYSEGKGDQGGIARAVGYLKKQKRAGALVFSGGDMINRGSPAWSDKFRCVEWSWLNGVVDAMALGNHDADYGQEEFSRCRQALRYPILSANTPGFEPFIVKETRGVRIGIFAVAGRDFPALMKQAGFAFTDPVDAARAAVAALREKHHVSAVVMIGHETTEEDEEIARSVPGIDVIFGTHSHEKKNLRRVAGSETWLISPSQYLTYISRVEITITRGRVAGVRGGLIRVDERLPRDAHVDTEVRRLEKELEGDPQYAQLFETAAVLDRGLSAEELGRKTVELMREKTRADLALSTTSSFRQALPPGPVSFEQLRTALPYDNEVVVCRATKGDVVKLLHTAAAANAETSAYVSPAFPPDQQDGYRVATTDYLARVAPGYRGLLTSCEGTGVRAREQLTRWLRESSTR